MPIYDFDCGTCGRFDAMRKVIERDTPAACPACGAPAARVASDLRGVRLPGRASAANRPASPAEGGYGWRHAGMCACCD